MATFFRNPIRQGMFGIAIKKKTKYRVKRVSNSVIKDRQLNRCNFKFVLFKTETNVRYDITLASHADRVLGPHKWDRNA